MLVSLTLSLSLFAPAMLSSGQEEAKTTPPKRAHHALAYDGSTQTIVMVGGSTSLDGGDSSRFFDDVWRLDAGGWKLAGHSGDERSGMALAYDSKRKQVVSLGGYTADGRSRSEFRALRDASWTVLQDDPGLPLAEPGLVYDSQRDRLVAFGGSAGHGKVNDETWEWDGERWKRFDGMGPEGRTAFAMVFDPARNKTIAFGGTGAQPGTLLGDTWEFDGAEWSRVAADGPGPRAAMGCAFDVERALLIVFGGRTKSGFTNDTWSWNGNEWRQLAEDGPPARAMGTLAYDEQRKRVVLFGGRLGWPNDANDTWEWDGSSWTERDRTLLAPDQQSAAPRPVDPTKVEADIDRAEQVLRRNGSDVSAILSDPSYRSVHGWPRFRELIKTHATGSRISIVTPQEPGERLRVRMRLVEADGSAPVGALVYFYQTDASGDYGPNDARVPLTGSDNNYARLFGFAVSDADGAIEIQPIRPGGYPDSGFPEHIHVRIMCRDKRSFGAEIWFDDDPRVTPELREEAAADRITICPVAIDAKGHASIEAQIKLD